ncbi:MAG: hypothetical protein AAFO72_11605 [Pseudomonadota bacterium]
MLETKGDHAALRLSPLGSSARSAPVIAVDAHVHFYPGANLGDALNAAWHNLGDACRAKGCTPGALCLLLTETASDNAFGALSAQRDAPKGWEICVLPDDPAALRAVRAKDGAELVIVAGRQIISVEQVEILAYATTDRPLDGKPLSEIVEMLRTAGTPAVLPWGLGKWMGARGRIVSRFFDAAATGEVMLGDNAGRPVGWPTPPLFRNASARAVPILPGSDPLPIPGAEKEIGSFGFVLGGALERQRPAEDLRTRLLALDRQPPVIGRRQHLPAVLAHQIALRRAKMRVG